jgi:hypothetical protein
MAVGEAAVERSDVKMSGVPWSVVVLVVHLGAAICLFTSATVLSVAYTLLCTWHRDPKSSSGGLPAA